MSITERARIARARRVGLLRNISGVSRTANTLATIENMRLAREAGLEAICYSPATGEEYPASPDDLLGAYLMGEPMCDEDGRPMVVCVKQTRYIDVFGGQEV